MFLNLRGGTLGTAATTGLLYQPRMIGDGDCGELVEWILAGETEVLGEKLPQGHFFYFVCESIGTAATPGLLC
jgi:hypothetical protein